jgi:hypothetical protein
VILSSRYTNTTSPGTDTGLPPKTKMPNAQLKPNIGPDVGLPKTGYISYTDPRFNYPYKGFCSIVCGIVDMSMEHYISNGDFSLVLDEPQTLNFFENISPRTDVTYDLGAVWLEKFFSQQLNHSNFNAHTPANLNNLKLKHKVFSNVLRLKSEYLELFESKRNYYQIDKDTLGVQIRGTDKKDEIPEIQLERIYKLIDQNIKDKIFVATDDKIYLDALQRRYGSRIIYDSSISISENRQPLHFNPSTRTQINEEVLSSVYLLSFCGKFLYSFSNVSHLALILGAYNHESIHHLNGGTKNRFFQSHLLQRFSPG